MCVQLGRKRRRDAAGRAATSPSPVGDDAASAASSGTPQNALEHDNEASEAIDGSPLQDLIGEEITKIQGKNTPIMSWDVAEVKPELLPLLREADDRISRISERKSRRLPSSNSRRSLTPSRSQARSCLRDQTANPTRGKSNNGR